jgi:hypothetical protein
MTCQLHSKTSIKRARNNCYFELKFIRFVRYIQFGCVISEEETPDPIPNSEVKLFSAEGSAREAWCEKRSMHPLYFKNPDFVRGFLFPKMQHHVKFKYEYKNT